MEAARAWQQGVVYPAWVQSAGWQAGEPRFVFYPPLTWMLGALLGSIFGADGASRSMASWTMAAWVFVFLALLLNGMATRRLAREWLSKGAAQLAGVLAIASPYGLFVAFERGALAELAASIWVPLALMLATRRSAGQDGTLRGQAVNLSTLGLALAVAGCWLTNAPAGVMVCYALAGVALVAVWTERAAWPALRALIAVLLGLGLAAFYLVPAAWEQRWVNIHAASDVGMRVEDSWLFARSAGVEMALHNAVLLQASWVLVLMVAATAVAALGLFLRGELPIKHRTRWLPLLLLVPVVLALQFPFSAGVWHGLPKAEFLQFPWRLTMLLTPALAIFAAQALCGLRRPVRGMIVVVWLLLAMAVCVGVFHQPCDEEDNVAAQIAAFQGNGSPPTDEYAPKDADNADLAKGLPTGCLVANPLTTLGDADEDGELRWDAKQSPCRVRVYPTEWSVKRKLLELNAPQAGYLIVRLRRFPAWQVERNGRSIKNLPKRTDGLMVVPVERGMNRIGIRWTDTADVRVGRWLSMMALLACVLMWIEIRRESAGG